jgi:hypothetical protein
MRGILKREKQFIESSILIPFSALVKEVLIQQISIMTVWVIEIEFRRIMFSL